MSREAMKLALEALEHMLEDAKQERLTVEYWNECVDAITAIKQARSAPVQEPWEPHDTAHRPGGLPQDFIKHEVENEGDWSEWVNPKPEQYFMKCCDCGLVHEMQFKIAKYSEGDECEFVADADLQAVFRARRTAPPAPVQEPVAWMHTMIDDVVVGHRPADLNVHPDRWMPLYKDPTPCQTCEALARTVMMDQTAHDTTPPAAQRQWVGLTDEDIIKCTPTWGGTVEDVARAIEAKLKEKNT